MSFNMKPSSSITNSWFHRLYVAHKGKVDGKHPTPTDEDKDSNGVLVPSEFEKGLIERWNTHSTQILKEYNDKIQNLEGKQIGCIEEYDNCVEKYKIEIAKYNIWNTVLMREVLIGISHKWYIFLMFLIGLGEFALNAQAFVIFQKTPLETWIMTGSLAVGIPVVAHFLGRLVKQYGSLNGAGLVKGGVIIAILVIIVPLTFYGINKARIVYIEQQVEQQEIENKRELASLGLESEISDEEFEKLKSNHIEKTKILDLAFLFINLFIFISATVMSYYSHDHEPNYEKLSHNIDKFDKKLDNLAYAIHKIGGQRDAAHLGQNMELGELEAIIRELIFKYRANNVKKRDDKKTPKVFLEKLVLPKPSSSEELGETQKIIHEDKLKEMFEKRNTYLNIIEGKDGFNQELYDNLQAHFHRETSLSQKEDNN